MLSSVVLLSVSLRRTLVLHNINQLNEPLVTHNYFIILLILFASSINFIK